MPLSKMSGRVVGEGEPEWTEEDRAWALALQLVDDRACPGCGKPSHEVWGLEHASEWEAQHFWCGSCVTAQQHGRQVADVEEQLPSGALRVITTRK